MYDVILISLQSNNMLLCIHIDSCHIFIKYFIDSTVIRDLAVFADLSIFVLCCFVFKIVYTTVNSTVSGHRQFQVTFTKTYLFFSLNDIVFLYFDYPVIFPNLIAASKLMLAVQTWLNDAVVTKRLTAPLPGKVYIPENCLHATAQTSIWSHNCSKPCIYFIYICR